MYVFIYIYSYFKVITTEYNTSAYVLNHLWNALSGTELRKFVLYCFPLLLEINWPQPMNMEVVVQFSHYFWLKIFNKNKLCIV